MPTSPSSRSSVSRRARWPRGTGRVLRRASPAGERRDRNTYPLLVNLPGWARRPVDRRDAIKKFGMSTILVTREYRRGDAMLTAQVAVVDTMWRSPGRRGMMGIKPGRNDPIGEPDVTRMFWKDNFGMVQVTLASDTQFRLTFTSVPSAEALELARRFDFKAIQAALPK